MADIEDCSRCWQEIHGRAIHDQGYAWHHACRVELVAERTAKAADRYIRRDPDAARVLADIQRKAA